MATTPTGLMCGLMSEPTSAETPLPTPRPRFSWIVPLTAPGDRQSAYQIQILDADKTVWDSGKVASAESVAVAALPQTVALPSGKPLAWRVRTWNAKGKESGWSAQQQFQITASAPAERTTTARYRLETVPVHPVRVMRPGEGKAFLDFGRDAFASLHLTLTAEKDGEIVTVHLGEAADGDTVRRKPGGSVRYLAVELPLRAGTHGYVVPLTEKDARRMPPEIGPVMPFRYVEVEGLHAPLSSGDATQVRVRYPFRPDAAAFRSSDPNLDAIWEMCRYSIEATTFCGLYVDGDRERLPYEADAYINQLGHYYADREFTLARHSHEHLILNPTWPTEWILFSVLIAWEDLLFSGDPESVRAFYDDLSAKTLHTIATPDGVLSTVEPKVPDDVLRAIHRLGIRDGGGPNGAIRDIVDWPLGERDGYELRPVNTVVNAFYCRALDRMARIAVAAGKSAEDVAAWKQRAATARATFNDRFFDKTAGLYIDGLGSAHASLHANMFPLAFDLVPADRVEKVADFVASKGMACSVYGAQFVLDALYNAGRADAALALMTATHDRGWLHMIRGVGTTIALEAWDPKYKPNLDWNHAWGAAPANIVPRRLLGVEPVEPGWKTIRVRPQPGKLTRASGLIPTVRGPIRVALDQSSPRRFALEIETPANTVTEVHVPGQSGDRVFVDGKERPTRPERLGDSSAFLALTEPLGGGKHRVERRSDRF